MKSYGELLGLEDLTAFQFVLDVEEPGERVPRMSPRLASYQRTRRVAWVHVPADCSADELLEFENQLAVLLKLLRHHAQRPPAKDTDAF